MEMRAFATATVNCSCVLLVGTIWTLGAFGFFLHTGLCFLYSAKSSNPAGDLLMKLGIVNNASFPALKRIKLMMPSVIIAVCVKKRSKDI